MSQEELSNPVGKPKESYEAGKLEKLGREVSATAIEAGAVFAAAVMTIDSSWDTRLAVMAATGLTFTAVGLSIKENGEKGFIKSTLGEATKTGLLGAAAAFAVDNPDVVMPMLEQIGKTTASATHSVMESDQQLPIKTALALGGLALLSWKGRDMAVGAYDIASAGVEAGKNVAAKASEKVIRGIGERLKFGGTKVVGIGNKLTKIADQPYHMRNEPVPNSNYDFPSPENYIKQEYTPQPLDKYRDPKNWTPSQPSDLPNVIKRRVRKR